MARPPGAGSPRPVPYLRRGGPVVRLGLPSPPATRRAGELDGPVSRGRPVRVELREQGEAVRRAAAGGAAPDALPAAAPHGHGRGADPAADPGATRKRQAPVLRGRLLVERD